MLLPFLAGCAGWSPTLADAGSAAREIACTVCAATSGPSEQASAYADALRRIAEALAKIAGDRDEVRAVLERLAKAQAAQAKDFEALMEYATAPGAKP